MKFKVAPFMALYSIGHTETIYKCEQKISKVKSHGQSFEGSLCRPHEQHTGYGNAFLRETKKHIGLS